MKEVNKKNTMIPGMTSELCFTAEWSSCSYLSILLLDCVNLFHSINEIKLILVIVSISFLPFLLWIWFILNYMAVWS